MEKTKIKRALTEKTREILVYIGEEPEDSLLQIIKTRYENALSFLQKEEGESRLVTSLRFLISSNRAYVGDCKDLDDPLRVLLMEADRLIDYFISDKQKG